jgi:peptidoglycan-associated lipoprotein
VKIMEQNPTLVIELGSHTDYRGSATYNRTLAQKRAQSAVDYLISKGVAKDRMEAKGYGEDAAKPIDSTYVAKNFTGEGANPRDFSNYVKKLKKTVIASAQEQIATFVVGVTLDEKFITALKTDGLKECAHQMNRRTEFRVLRTDYKPGQTATEEKK